MTDGDASIASMAARLTLLREWAGFADNKAAFARRSGFTPSEWQNYESGSRRLSVTAALRLRRNWRVTLDWLYEGDRAGLSVEVSSSLPHLDEWRARRQAS
jgi:transcriptional regulator with XRE-family HTH domain